MLCLMGKPSKLDQTRFPGSKTRYDDFVVVHINQTMSIHGTVGYPPTPQNKAAAVVDQVNREASSRGIATTPGLWSKLFGMSAGIRGPSLYVV